MARILTPTRVHTEQLTRSRVDGKLVLSAEASDLPSPGRVYDDACDVGYTLISERTGNQQVVCEHSSERDADGDLLWTDYVPVGSAAADLPINFTLRIYND